MPRSRRRNAPLPFSRRLVLHRWLLDLFGVERFDRIAEHLRDESLEGLDEDNVHRFHRALCLHLPAERRPALPDEVLLEHDQAIVSVTARLNEQRITRGEPPIVWKYFQYLALLFTEIYLERWFRDPRALLAALNDRIAAFNEGKAKADRVSMFDEAATESGAATQLNKLAFWMATGSGKTLLMHAHVLRYRRLLMRHGRARDLNRILLLTPNEGLSRQHLREFEAAGIEAEIFSKENRGLFTGQAVEILEITKLRDEMGDRTVAVEAFEGNNLVLIDEGHRGAAAGEDGAWMRFRNALCEKGFSFEYSATFGQAVKGNPALADLYARGTLFDYSYRWFYGDGFGKDYRILNLEDDGGAEWMATWLTACLLAFFQQQRLYREHEAALRPFNLERPLWIFVGGRVTATLAKRDASDIVEILRFLAGYVSDRAGSVARIREILAQGLVSAAWENLFAGRFTHLAASGLAAEQVFGETLDLLFNARRGGALHVETLAAHRVPGGRSGLVHRCDAARHRGRTGRDERVVMATYSDLHGIGSEQAGGAGSDGGVLRCRARSVAGTPSPTRSASSAGAGAIIGCTAPRRLQGRAVSRPGRRSGPEIQSCTRSPGRRGRRVPIPAPGWRCGIDRSTRRCRHRKAGCGCTARRRPCPFPTRTSLPFAAGQRLPPR